MTAAGWLSAFAAFFRGGGCFEQGELEFLFHRIDAVKDHVHGLTQTLSLARALSDNLAGGLVIDVMIVGECVQRNQAFHEQVG